MKIRFLPWPLKIVTCTLLLHSTVYAGQLRAGTGRASVTPPASEFPYPPSDVPSLNTGPGERNFVGVHDEIYARALILDDGVTRVALVTLEVTTIPEAEDLINAIAQEIGVSKANVMLAATHTHSVPLFSSSGTNPTPREMREIELLKKGALDAVRQAKAHLQPARVAFGRGSGWVNVNNGEQNGSHAGYDPHGPSDKSLDVIRFETLEGSPLAIVINYASHAEVMFRSVTKNNGYEVSGDLPGAVSRIIETSSPSAPLALFTSGAEADQLTTFKSLQSGGPLPPADEGASGWALLDAQARSLTNSVLGVLSTLSGGASEVHIAASSGATTCPGQQIKIDTASGQVGKEDKPPVVIPLSMIKLNDIVLAGVGGDVATLIGQHLKAESPTSKTTMITVVGSSVGYVFSDDSYVHPGHGITKSLLKPGCADRAIVDGLIHMIRSAQ